MHKKSLLVLATLAVLTTGTATVAAYINTPSWNGTIVAVEVQADGRVYIHTNGHLSRPACSTKQAVVTCSLSRKFCEPAMKVALTAQLAEKEVHIKMGTECFDGITELTSISSEWRGAEASGIL